MKLRVVSPWYPSEYSPYSGKFVQSQVAALRNREINVSVEIPRIFAASKSLNEVGIIDGLKRIAEINIDNLYTQTDGTTCIPCPVYAPASVLSRAKGFETGLSLKHELVQDDADVVHAHLGMPTGWAVSRSVNESLVVTEHQSNLRNLLADSRALEAYMETINRAAAFICVSEFLKNYVIDLFGSEISKPINVVPNVVDFDSLDLIHREEYKCLSWIYVGTLSQNKGVVRLLKAFALYKRKVAPEATLTIIGVGPLFHWIESFIRRQGIRNNVFLLGAKSHESLKDHFSKADLMVHLSESETFGIASLEALASGVPVVSFHNGGSDSTWRDIERSSGSLLEKDSTEIDIVEAIVDLTENAGRLDFREARSWLEEKFSAEVVCDQLLSIYRSSMR